MPENRNCRLLAILSFRVFRVFRGLDAHTKHLLTQKHNMYEYEAIPELKF